MSRAVISIFHRVLFQKSDPHGPYKKRRDSHTRDGVTQLYITTISWSADSSEVGNGTVGRARPMQNTRFHRSSLNWNQSGNRHE